MKKFHNMILRIIRNFFYDIRYGGIFLGGIQKTRYDSLGAYDIVNTDYGIMSDIFNDILVHMSKKDVLVDVGCGKGRVINWWLMQGIKNRIIGLELDLEIAAETRKRLLKYKNVEIIEGDAIKNLPRDGTIFYLYNPFDEKVTERFRNRIVELFSNRKNLTILYHNCYHLSVFEKDSRFKIKEVTVQKTSHNTALIQFV